jgi:hypothetical protein
LDDEPESANTATPLSRHLLTHAPRQRLRSSGSATLPLIYRSPHKGGRSSPARLRQRGHRLRRRPRCLRRQYYLPDSLRTDSDGPYGADAGRPPQMTTHSPGYWRAARAVPVTAIGPASKFRPDRCRRLLRPPLAGHDPCFIGPPALQKSAPDYRRLHPLRGLRSPY